MNDIDVLQLLDEANVAYKLQKGGREVLVDCLECGHHKPKLSINVQSGFWRCFVCNDTGGLNKYLKKLGTSVKETPLTPSSEYLNNEQILLLNTFKNIHWYHPTGTEAHLPLSQYLASRGLTLKSPEIMDNIGYSSSCIVFAMRDPLTKSLKALKYKALDPESPYPYKMIGEHPGLFVPNINNFQSTESIILVEGEIDALSVAQMLQAENIEDLTVAATTGISNKGCVKYLNNFKNIYVWFDNESDPKLRESVTKARESLVQEIVKQNNGARIFTINQTEGKDANDYLLNQGMLTNLIHAASEHLDHQLSRPASFYLGDMMVYLKDSTKALGQPTLLDGLDKLLGGGKRLGEITALHAAGKTGKNALWHQLIYNWIEIGLPQGYASRELSPDSEVLPNLFSIHYGANMWREFNGKKKQTNVNEADLISLLNRWPLHFAHGYGVFDIDQITGWVEELKSKGVHYFWIDHFHYCLDDSENPKEISKFARQLKSIAKKMNVHIDLIVQPKQIQEGQKLNLSSLRGSAAIGQAIDSLFTLERVPGQTNVSKLRLEAARHRLARQGDIFLKYDPESTRIVEVEEDPESIIPDKPKKTWELPN